MKIVLALTAVAALSVAALAETPPKMSGTVVGNLEMKSIFADDQRVRQPGYKGEWKDEPRRAKVRELLAKNALKSGIDFEEAAFVFQHGQTPDDFLMAHTLAMIAVAKGRQNALWIASATLDRYLQHIGQKQIYGTQYQVLDSQGRPSIDGHWSQEPYDRTLISDALRHEIGVPTQAQQKALFEKMRGYFKDVQDRLKTQAGK
jgi:hypothetical protein